MTKKDFETIAIILKSFNQIYWNEKHELLIGYTGWCLQKQNPKFKLDLFIKACN